LLTLVSFSQSAASSFLSLFALAKGFEGIGLYFTLNAVGVFASRFVMWRIVDWLGERATVVASVAVIAASTVGMAFANSIDVLYAIAIPLGFAVGMLSPVVNARVVAVMPESRSGLANALFYAAGDVGFITGPTLWGVIAEAASYETTFLASAGVLAACAVAALFCGFEGGRDAE
jgi:MFS family permease